MHIPSFENGYAPRDGEPLYPNLFKGLIGAWCPSLGVTGGTLRDVSGRNNHGTATGMTLATDWQLQSGQYGIQTANPNKYVECRPVPIEGTTDFTVSLWVNVAKTQSAADNLVPLFGQKAPAASEAGFMVVYFYAGGNAGKWLLSTGSGAAFSEPLTSGTANVTGTIAHVVMRRGAGLAQNGDFVINGIQYPLATTLTILNITTTTNMTWGRDATGFRQTNQVIFEAACWRRCLHLNEIAELYRIGRGGMYALRPPKKYWNFKYESQKPRKSQQIIIKHDSPSLENGFAPRDGETLYPNLFKGLVGAWCPSMGVTGGILRDVSGRNNHGTLTNMDPATDWVIDGGKGALDFDGVNDYVEAQQVNLATSFTISFG